MKRILITGAGSYLGGSFERYLGQWPDRYQVDTVDMVDGSWREKSFAGYDSVYHVAGIAHSDHGKLSEAQSQLYYRVNRDLAIETAEKAKKDGISVVYDEPDMLPFICGDKNRIRQVFINVIDNAIKYSDKNGLVSIQAGMEDTDHIRIDVSDTGCGISKHDLPKIKTKFYKANHTRRGSGIGLAVADEIIAMHGGQLNITSEQNVGTTVTIILPVQKS